MTDEHVLGEGGSEKADAPFQILSLSGGGYRGLYSAMLLEQLELKAGKPLARVFDLVAGTSIGGILAIGLAAEVPASALRRAFEEHGGGIFPRSYRIGGVPVLPRIRIAALRRRYGAGGLKTTIEAVLAAAPGSASTVADLKVPVLITAVDVTNAQPRIFGLDSTDATKKLVDVALATSAAPTYFAEHRFDQTVFVDGGLVANAPDGIALARAFELGHSRERVWMLSLGTVGGRGGEAARKPSGRGWIFTGKRLFDLTLAAQQKLACQLTEAQIGNRYIRLDTDPSAGQAKAIGLDRTDRKAVETLQGLADETIRRAEQRSAAALRGMLGRTAAHAAA